MAASDNPEVGTAMCRGFIQQIMEVTIGYRIHRRPQGGGPRGPWPPPPPVVMAPPPTPISNFYCSVAI